jgi:hypothetical protein
MHQAMMLILPDVTSILLAQATLEARSTMLKGDSMSCSGLRALLRCGTGLGVQNLPLFTVQFPTTHNLAHLMLIFMAATLLVLT